jgi:hypothetical protein
MHRGVRDRELVRRTDLEKDEGFGHSS